MFSLLAFVLFEFLMQMLPPAANSDNPSTSFAAKFVHTSINKNRCSINRVLVSSTFLIRGKQQNL